MLCFLANTRAALSGRLRPGKADANTAADHITVLDHALAQIPDAHRHGTDILVHTDAADPRKPSSPASAPCGNEESVPSSRSDTPSPSRSDALSGPSLTASGIPP